MGIGWVGRGSRAGGRGGCVRMGLHDGGDDSGALGAEGRGHGKGGGGRISSPGRTETVTTQRARGDRSGLTLGRRSDWVSGIILFSLRRSCLQYVCSPHTYIGRRTKSRHPMGAFCLDPDVYSPLEPYCQRFVLRLARLYPLHSLREITVQKDYATHATASCEAHGLCSLRRRRA